jgi:pyridoxamine 5'-phosphate oxidase-like protein
VLSEELARFLGSGLAIVVATRDDTRTMLERELVDVTVAVRELYHQTPDRTREHGCDRPGSARVDPRLLARRVPSAFATCALDGTPNITYMSIVQCVDSDRVALSRQFFNKTRADLDGNPKTQVRVVDPETVREYVLDLHYMHTETHAPIFEQIIANNETIASAAGMSGVFRLRGVDIHRVLQCAQVGRDGSCPPGGSGADRLSRRRAQRFRRRRGAEPRRRRLRERAAWRPARLPRAVEQARGLVTFTRRVRAGLHRARFVWRDHVRPRHGSDSFTRGLIARSFHAGELAA